jgi:hypothetical protein
VRFHAVERGHEGGPVGRLSAERSASTQDYIEVIDVMEATTNGRRGVAGKRDLMRPGHLAFINL